ncbi:GDSL esterase/lipase [Acorus calamus]|uniref:GDSL esterase/lipase n=1 Tax=Acorus calamus TaxID=4465 RepID=A0AAV9FCB2_ACOCL|nr:GDSL esterase/lipase [Acorus calamus]
MVVGGSIPLGCTPIYLTLFGTQNRDDYEPGTGCLKWANELSEYHDHLLQKEIQRARRKHSHATIAFANYYSILKLVFRSPNEYVYITYNPKTHLNEISNVLLFVPNHFSRVARDTPFQRECPGSIVDDVKTSTYKYLIKRSTWAPKQWD